MIVWIQELDIDAAKDPTKIIIPGNTPHGVKNIFDKSVKIFYYFPDGEDVLKEVHYHYPDGTIKPPGSSRKNSMVEYDDSPADCLSQNSI